MSFPPRHLISRYIGTRLQCVSVQTTWVRLIEIIVWREKLPPQPHCGFRYGSECHGLLCFTNRNINIWAECPHDLQRPQRNKKLPGQFRCTEDCRPVDRLGSNGKTKRLSSRCISFQSNLVRLKSKVQHYEEENALLQSEVKKLESQVRHGSAGPRTDTQIRSKLTNCSTP